MTLGTTDATRRFAWHLALLTLAAAVLRTIALPGQPPTGDDLGAAASAINFVERAQVGPTMWHHPRLRDLLVYASQVAFGTSKLGLVLPSLLLGIAAVPVTGLLARRFAGDRPGLLAALLLAIDPLHVDYSRQAVQECYLAFFAAAGVLTTLRYLDTRRAGWAVAAGTLFGLGLASKWSVAFPLGASVVWACWRVERDAEREPYVRRATLSLVFATLLLLPAAVYLATWAPWFAGGRALSDWLHLQNAMATEATHHAGFNVATLEHPHHAATWFLWPSSYADAAIGPEGRVPLVAISNPLSWLATLPAVGWLVFTARRGEGSERGFLAALVLASWLPFAVTTRPIWVHSALGVLPFAFAAVAWFAHDLAARGRLFRRSVMAWLVACLLVAVPLWALATGVAVNVPGLREIALSYRPAVTFERPAAP
jgi:4-amino-4-deoxy-L-arabinose transferase-like glycosyltransferase